MRYINRCLGVIVSVAAALGIVQAQNLVQNGSFEDPPIPPPGGGSFNIVVGIGSFGPPANYVTNWLVTAQNVDLVYDTSSLGQDGNQYLELNGSPGLGRIEQQVTVPAGQGGLYYFRFKASASWSLSNEPDPDNPGLTYGQVDATLPRKLLAEVLPAGGGFGISQVVTLTAPYGNFNFFDYEFVILLYPGTWTVAFESLTNSRPWPEVGATLANSLGVRVDDVQLVLVPEPSSLLALAAGGLGALLWRRRRNE